MRVHSKKTVKECWDTVVVEYTLKGAYAQTDMRQKLRCADKGNVHKFLDDLWVRRGGISISGSGY